MTSCDPRCQMIVGTATTGVTLVCVLIMVCIGFWARFWCEPVAVVQENPATVATARVQPVEESDDPQPVV